MKTIKIISIAIYIIALAYLATIVGEDTALKVKSTADVLAVYITLFGTLIVLSVLIVGIIKQSILNKR